MDTAPLIAGSFSKRIQRYAAFLHDVVPSNLSLHILRHNYQGTVPMLPSRNIVESGVRYTNLRRFGHTENPTSIPQRRWDELADLLLQVAIIPLTAARTIRRDGEATTRREDVRGNALACV